MVSEGVINVLKKKLFQLDNNYIDYVCVRCRVRRIEERRVLGIDRWHQIAELRESAALGKLACDRCVAGAAKEFHGDGGQA
jgi:hypothetical protein